ncbi:MAG TPA: hypothetical protein VH416_00095 [Gaiellaceae bacterium]|jgi:hypothetical protein
MRRKLVVLAGFVTGVVVGTVLYRRGTQGRRERVDLYFDDGSMVSHGDGSTGAERLLPIAHSILVAARRP